MQDVINILLRHAQAVLLAAQEQSQAIQSIAASFGQQNGQAALGQQVAAQQFAPQQQAAQGQQLQPPVQQYAPQAAQQTQQFAPQQQAAQQFAPQQQQQEVVTADMLLAIVKPLADDPNARTLLQQAMHSRGIATLPDTKPEQYADLYNAFKGISEQLKAQAGGQAQGQQFVPQQAQGQQFAGQQFAPQQGQQFAPQQQFVPQQQGQPVQGII